MDEFDKWREVGLAGESLIAKWLMVSGWQILPIYEKIIGDYKGPTLYTIGKRIIAPDLLCFNSKRGVIRWIEAKHKTAFSWYRKSRVWTTGIDSYLFDEYLEIRESIGLPLFLMFLHKGGHAKDSPETSPAGLFGGEILELRNCVNHCYGEDMPNNYGRGGMTYWDKDSLIRYTSYENVISCARKVADIRQQEMAI